MELLNREMIDNSDAYADEYELYDKCISFINGAEPTPDQIKLIREYFINCIGEEKYRFYGTIRDYIADLQWFIGEYDKLDSIHRERFNKTLYDIFQLRDMMHEYDESISLKKYIIRDDYISKMIDDLCTNVLIEINKKIDYISILDKSYYSNDIYVITTYEWLEKFFKTLSKYNDLYLEFVYELNMAFLNNRKEK